MSHPVVHYPLLLFTTSRNYDVVDLARQSNPNFFIVTPAPSRGRKLGKPAKQKIEWGKIKQIKVVLKLVVMVKADDFYGHCGSNLTQSRSFFFRGCCWGRSEADDDLHCFSLTKENLVVVVNGVSSFQKDFFLPYLPTKRRSKKVGKSSTFRLKKKLFSSSKNFFEL